MITVHARLHLLPGHCGGKDEISVSLHAGATASDLLAALQIPRGDIGVITFGDAHVMLDDVLTDGTVVDLYPIVAGG